MSKKEEKVAEVVVTEAEVVNEDETAVAVQQETAPASNGLGNLGTVGGPVVLDWSWIHLKFEMSKKRPDANQGEFFLGREWETKLCDKGGNIGVGQAPKPNQRFQFVIVGRLDGYKHYVTQAEFNAGIMPKRYFVDATKQTGWSDARKAALEAGETLEGWRDGDPSKGEPPRVGPSATPFMQLKVLVKKPENCDAGEENFCVALDGEFYAPAILEFDKLNWEKAYKIVDMAVRAELVKQRQDPTHKPSLLDKVFWGFSSAVERPGRNGAPSKVVTTPMMMRAVENGTPVVLSKAAVEDIQALVSGAASGPVSDEAF